MSDVRASLKPLVLASKSASRRAMLDAVGVPYDAVPADVDERALEADLAGAAPSIIVLALAKAKARQVGDGVTGEKLVLGSDSLVSVAGRRFDKPESREQAAEHLRFFSGKVMELHSAAALWRGADDNEGSSGNGRIVWTHAETAHLHVRELSDTFIADYLDREWPAVSQCVGVFRIEGPGPLLFGKITGDYFTILGMPLLAVLERLRAEGVIQV
ncbi:Maf-like protein [Alteripontixanthobacter maritimus]|uniref:Nucleoside triphosphate pyrophosphatase n=1 Tax=Alteripontixanthobacter maritimus TaxID=2161824 RepID=A0A369Q8W0_9SPHN|nr:Maf family protein [Alteripontixanthobacter maritimus]RDC61154.1 Maf-like protein [Alteripontixanthobacter maritimus]